MGIRRRTQTTDGGAAQTNIEVEMADIPKELIEFVKSLKGIDDTPKAALAIPTILETQDWSAVQKLCEQYFDDLIKTGYADEDTAECVFEAAVQAVYGDKVWAFIRTLS